MFFLTFAGAQTDIAVFNRHINAQGAQIIQDFVTLLEIPNVAYDLQNIYKNAQYIMAEFCLLYTSDAADE